MTKVTFQRLEKFYLQPLGHLEKSRQVLLRHLKKSNHDEMPDENIPRYLHLSLIHES